MARKKSIHDVLEKSALPIVVIILIPVGFFVYAALHAATNTSTPVPTQQTQTQQTNVVENITQATIALNNASALPQSAAAAQLVPFSFTIRNSGSTDGTVPYKVYVKWSTGEQDVIDENIAPLAAGASTVVQEQLKFEIATETADVYLELTQTGQIVQFQLPRK